MVPMPHGIHAIVALSVTINGIKTAVGEGGRTFDVKNADSATIVATFVHKRKS